MPDDRTKASRPRGFLDFAPSLVILAVPLPLVDTMGRAEREMAAAMIVATCAARGDRWMPVLPKEIGEMLESARASKSEPWFSLSTNPFMPCPDFYGLVDHGFAVGALATHGPIQLTLKARTSIRAKWYRPAPQICVKCGSVAPATDWLRELPEPGSPEDLLGFDILQGDLLFGEHFTEVYRCPAHDDFGVRGDGEQIFGTPDIWVEGPRGERIFRT